MTSLFQMLTSYKLYERKHFCLDNNGKHENPKLALHFLPIECNVCGFSGLKYYLQKGEKLKTSYQE